MNISLKEYREKNLTKMNGTIYNQNENTTPNDCAPYSIMQIFGLTYGIWIKPGIRERVIQFFLKVGALLKFGSVFSIIYPVASDKANKIIEAKILEHELATGKSSGIIDGVQTHKVIIGTSAFKQKLDDGFALGLGLKLGNHVYTNAAKQGLPFTKALVDKILTGGKGFQHNNVLYKDSSGKLKIYEIWSGKTLETDIDTINYAADKGLFYYPARTFYIQDNKLRKQLMDMNKGISEEVTDDNYSVVSIASDLRVFNVN